MAVKNSAGAGAAVPAFSPGGAAVSIDSVDGIVAHAGAAWRRRLHRAAAVRWHVAGGVHCGRLVVHETEPGYRTLRRWFAYVVLAVAVLVAAAVIVNPPRWDDIGPDS